MDLRIRAAVFVFCAIPARPRHQVATWTARPRHAPITKRLCALAYSVADARVRAGTLPAHARDVRRRGETLAGLLFVVAAAACGAPTVTSLGADASPTPNGQGSPTPAASSTPVGASGHLRLMAANLSTGTQQSWDPGEGMRILEGFKPDVVMIQEFNYKTNSAADIRAFVDAVCGTECSVAREATGAQIPNGIISRYPILDAGTWTDPQVGNRGFEWARIDVPGAVDLYAVSVHLLTTSAADRNAEAQALVAKIQQALPAGALFALGGDFNTGSRTEVCVSTLAAVIDANGPFPADRNGNENTSASRSAPHDWVLVNASLQAHATATSIGTNTFAAGLVADTRVYSPVTDIAPALAGDSGASGMQHMGVVRDFEL